MACEDLSRFPATEPSDIVYMSSARPVQLMALVEWRRARLPADGRDGVSWYRIGGRAHFRWSSGECARPSESTREAVPLCRKTPAAPRRDKLSCRHVRQNYPVSTLAGREHIASASGNVRLPTKRVVTGHQQGASTGKLWSSRTQESGRCRFTIVRQATARTQR